MLTYNDLRNMSMNRCFYLTSSQVKGTHIRPDQLQ